MKPEIPKKIGSSSGTYYCKELEAPEGYTLIKAYIGRCVRQLTDRIKSNGLSAVRSSNNITGEDRQGNKCE